MMKYKVISDTAGPMLDEKLNELARDNWNPVGFSTSYANTSCEVIVTVMLSKYEENNAQSKS